MRHWRLCVHALDRTGPAVLTRSFVRWLQRTRPADQISVIAFRGGDVLDDLPSDVSCTVCLEPSEAWDHRAPVVRRVEQIRARLGDQPPPDATLLVSVAAGQVLGLLPHADRSTVIWVVEQGEDLHWLDPPVDLAHVRATWLAGSEGTRAELAGRLPPATAIDIVPEFIEVVDTSDATLRARRGSMDPTHSAAVVVGAGIGTVRKAPDLFVEVALACRRRGRHGLRFVWIGGERDPLIPLLRQETKRLGLSNVTFRDSVEDIDTWVGAADLLLHPARLDAFPLICLHAAVAGTPVASFRGCGGVEEMFGDAFLGVDYPDIEAMADLVCTVADAGGSRIAEAQRRSVLTSFTSDVAGPRVLEHLFAAAEGRTIGAKP